MAVERLSPPQDLCGRRYAMVGGGLSGLAAAWYLQQRGAETHIFERDPALGGRAGSGRLGQRTVTLGGKNIGHSYTRFRAFTHSLGEPAYEHFGINSSRVLEGRLVTFDSAHRARALSRLTRLPPLDLARLVRLALEIRRDPNARYLDPDHCRRLARRYRGESVQQAFGAGLRRLLLRSLTVRVSAAEPAEVPIANVMPYVGMILDSYDQLAGGMHEIIAAAAARSRVRLQSEVTGLLCEHGRVCGVRLDTPERFDGVVLATPAHAAAQLLQDSAPELAGALREVRYFPVTVVLAEYERSVFDARVRAIVFGEDQPLSNAGAYGLNDLNVVRYTFSGRRARSLAAGEPDGELLAGIAESILAPYANIGGNRRRALVARRFSPGLCAYHPDQAGLLDRLGAPRALPDGLALAGDYLRGCSIEACFLAAQQAVAAMMAEPRAAAPAQSPALTQSLGGL